MNKILSVRRNKQISSLLAEIQEYQGSVNRTEIINLGLEAAVENIPKWKDVLKIKIKEIEFDTKQPEFMQIRVNENTYDKVAKQIKNSFGLKRLTAPYLIQLVLVNYLSMLKGSKKEEIINTAEQMINFGIDCLVFKNAYDVSDEDNKEELLDLVRKYLEKYNIELNEKIRSLMNLRIKQYSDFFNIEKYAPKRRSNFGTCDIRFVSKILAGVLLILSEIGEFETDDIIYSMKNIMK